MVMSSSSSLKSAPSSGQQAKKQATTRRGSSKASAPGSLAPGPPKAAAKKANEQCDETSSRRSAPSAGQQARNRAARARRSSSKASAPGSLGLQKKPPKSQANPKVEGTKSKPIRLVEEDAKKLPAGKQQGGEEVKIQASRQGSPKQSANDAKNKAGLQGTLRNNSNSKRIIPIKHESFNSAESNDVGLKLLDQWDVVTASKAADTACSPLDMAYTTEGMSVKQLPWTHDDTKQVMAQIQFMQDELLGGRGAVNENITLWKEGLKNLKIKLEKTMNGNGGNSMSGSAGMLSRDDPLLKQLTSTMRGINLVDMPKLKQLMMNSQQAGDIIEGKDVILLCGETGAGKTTTLQFLLGTSFEEVEADGFVHMNPVSFSDEEHKKFKTSFTREPTTRTLQAATVVVNDEEVAVCDAPSYDVANCLEEDIALGLGMVQAIRRANSVRPVVVLSREGMGSRFKNLPETMRIVTRLCNVRDKEDWIPFSYVFTKYEEKHRKLIHKQFAALQRNPPKIGKGQLQELYEAFVEDIAEKTNPEAHVILPIEGHPANVLSSLQGSPVATASPKQLCEAFASDFSLKQMNLQMDVELHNFRGLLLQEEYPAAIKSIKHMIDMSGVFPDMQSHIQQAKEAFLQQVAQVWVLVVRSIGKQDYRTALYRMQQLSTIAKEFPDAVECLELGHEMLSQSITEPFTDLKYKTAIERLVSLSALQERFSEASKAVNLGLQTLKETLDSLVEAKDFDTVVKLIQQLGRAEADMPDAFGVAQHGLHLVREKLMLMIEDENYSQGIELTKRVSELGPDLAEANVYVRKVLKVFRKRIDQTIQCGDYVKAGYLLRNLCGLGTNLHDGSEYVESAYDASAQHVCELRMEVVNAFETLLKVKENKKYSQLLEYALTAMSNLMKSEPMRLVCAELYQGKKRKQSGDAFKPNYLAILCTPKDCSSEAFCVAQVRHLVQTVSGELSDLEPQNTDVAYLMSHRKSVLSVILRLRSAAKVFKDGPGGSMAASMYDKAFVKFQTMIGCLLALSEASFDSSMEMKEFEFQTWFLAFLIQGFTKENDGALKGEDTQAVEDLDHRRVTLMLRFENEISDTMELLANYSFPDLQVGTAPPDFAAFFAEIKLSDLEAPRQLLVSLGQAPQLCKMMATMLSAKDAERAVASLDKSLVELFANIIQYLEGFYEKMIQELKGNRISRRVAFTEANKMCGDITMVCFELSAVNCWSDGNTPGLQPIILRLAEIEETTRALVDKLDEKSLAVDDISPAAFVWSIFAATGDCACFGGGSHAQDEFLVTLPVLSKPPQDPMPALMDSEQTPPPVAEAREESEKASQACDNKEETNGCLTPAASNTSPCDGKEINNRSLSAAGSQGLRYDGSGSRAPTPAADSSNMTPPEPTEPIDPEEGGELAPVQRASVDC